MLLYYYFHGLWFIAIRAIDESGAPGRHHHKQSAILIILIYANRQQCLPRLYSLPILMRNEDEIMIESYFSGFAMHYMKQGIATNLFLQRATKFPSRDIIDL